MSWLISRRSFFIKAELCEFQAPSVPSQPHLSFHFFKYIKEHALSRWTKCKEVIPEALNVADGINSSEDTYRCLAICHHISGRHKQSVPSVKVCT